MAEPAPETPTRPRSRQKPLLAAAGVAAAMAALGALPGGGHLGPASAVSLPTHVNGSSPAPVILPASVTDSRYVPPEAQNGASDTRSRMAHLKRWN